MSPFSSLNHLILKWTQSYSDNYPQLFASVFFPWIVTLVLAEILMCTFFEALFSLCYCALLLVIWISFYTIQIKTNNTDTIQKKKWNVQKVNNGGIVAYPISNKNKSDKVWVDYRDGTVTRKLGLLMLLESFILTLAPQVKWNEKTLEMRKKKYITIK